MIIKKPTPLSSDYTDTYSIAWWLYSYLLYYQVVIHIPTQLPGDKTDTYSNTRWLYRYLLDYQVTIQIPNQLPGDYADTYSIIKWLYRYLLPRLVIIQIPTPPPGDYTDILTPLHIRWLYRSYLESWKNLLPFLQKLAPRFGKLGEGGKNWEKYDILLHRRENTDLSFSIHAHQAQTFYVQHTINALSHFN